MAALMRRAALLRGPRVALPLWVILLAAFAAAFWGGLVPGLVPALVLGGSQKLCLRAADGRLVFASPLPTGQEFCLRFVHSVALSPVEEWFVLRQREGKVQIVLESTVYQDFGAGLPHQSGGAGQVMTFGQGLVQIKGYNQPLPHLTLRISRVPGHVLLLEGAEGPPTKQIFASPERAGRVFTALALDSLAPAGAALSLSVEQCIGNICRE